MQSGMMANFYGAFFILVTVSSFIAEFGTARGQLTPCSPSQLTQCGNQSPVPEGEFPCFTTGSGPDDFICNCGATPSFSFDFGRLCTTPVDSRILLSSLQTCYGCSQNYFTSINYPGSYGTVRGDVYLLYIPGALQINFEFSGPFSVEAGKDDLFVGRGLEFSHIDVNQTGLEPGEIISGSLYYFDNRAIKEPGQDEPTQGRVPNSFSISGDTAWIYFRTDRNVELEGFNLTWSATVADTDPPMLLCPGNIVLTVLDGVTTVPIQWPLPIVSDVSEPVTLLTASHTPGDEFPVGITTVRYEYKDAFQNTASCTFDIQVMTESPCNIDPCLNGGTCVAIDLDTTSCVCPRCFTGDVCQIAVDACSGNICFSGATCIPVPGSCEQYTCTCPPCFTGPFCNIVGDVCVGNLCGNGAVCLVDSTDCTKYTCICPPCYSGPFCQIRTNGCWPNPCRNDALCTDLSALGCNAYRCDCIGCFDGINCDRVIPNPCEPNPCYNGGSCTRNLQFCSTYTCQCSPGFEGENCQIESVIYINPCSSFPCENGASCSSQELDTNYVCICPPGFTGINCGMMTAPGANLCFGNPCQNGGSCYASYYSGSSSFVYTPQYMCLCAVGFTGTNCQFRANESPSQDICTMELGVCQNGGTCTNTFNSFTGDVDFVCTDCLEFAIGKTCEIIVPDACNSSPCINGGTCVTEDGGFTCICSAAHQGVFCQIPGADFQPPVITGCPDDITQMGPSPVIFTPPQATDNSGYERLLFMSHTPGQVFPIGITAVSYIFGDAAGNQDQCTFYVTINDGGLPFYILVFNCPGNIVASTNTGNAVVMFETPFAVSRDGRASLVNQSHTSGSSFTAGTTTSVYFTFRDAAGNQAECTFDVTVNRVDDCFQVCAFQFSPVCGSDGMTYSNLCEFEAAQCRVPSLTSTPGACIEDPCSSSPCFGGGTCFRTGTESNFMCLCPAGRSGDLCEIDIESLCASSPCQHDGTCVELSSIFICLCQPEFSGNFCEQDLTPCDPNPCLESGTCLSLPANNTYLCVCPPGRSGPRCENSDDLCDPNPCWNGGQCFDLGNGEIFCLCSGGFSGERCEFVSNLPCEPNPCLEGGTCISVPANNTYLCVCPPGKTGPRCENSDSPCDRNPCLENGTCLPLPVNSTFLCVCPPGKTGSRCENSDPCEPNLCLNGGQCFDLDNGEIFCLCYDSFSGERCEIVPILNLIVDSDLCQDRTVTLSLLNSFEQVDVIVPNATFNGVIVPPTSFGGRVLNLEATTYYLGEGPHCFIYNYEFQGHTATYSPDLIVDSDLCQDRTVTLSLLNSFEQVDVIVPNATFNGVIVPPTSFGGSVSSLEAATYYLCEGPHRFIYNYEYGGQTAACDFTIFVA